MNAEMELGTNKKAFQINLDSSRYGTFAEIGAGQEVRGAFSRSGRVRHDRQDECRLTTCSSAMRSTGQADRYVSRDRTGHDARS
jgi:hypothetical protein